MAKQNEFNETIERLTESWQHETRDLGPFTIAGRSDIDDWIEAREIDRDDLERWLGSVYKSVLLMALVDLDIDDMVSAVAGGAFQMGFEMALHRYAGDRMPPAASE